MTAKYQFYRHCVNWPAADVHVDGGLVSLIATRKEITRRTFLRHVDRKDFRYWEEVLGHPQFPMSRDYHVEYFRSTLHGRRVYGFRHSGIEYVFVLYPWEKNHEHVK